MAFNVSKFKFMFFFRISTAFMSVHVIHRSSGTLVRSVSDSFRFLGNPPDGNLLSKLNINALMVKISRNLGIIGMLKHMDLSSVLFTLP